MPRFAIAFITPETKCELRHKIVDSQDQDSALRKFFDEECGQYYSNDDQGFHYFKEDFFETKTGSIIKQD